VSDVSGATELAAPERALQQRRAIAITEDETARPEKEEEVKSKWLWILMLGVVGAAAYGGVALATAPAGVTTTVFGVGRFNHIDAKTKTDINPGRARDFWKAAIKTKGASDLYVLQNTITPGGTFGWHSHPGPSLVIVKSGTATFYMGDPGCPSHVVPTGSGFVDNGHDLHVVRNEGSVDLVTVVVSLVPAGFTRRIDEPAPASCPALQNG
jgi:quercetin dioxygenase-like cupin family protein